MSNRYPEQRNNRRPSQSESDRRRAAARAQKQKEYRRIRTLTIVIAVLLIAIIVVVIVACTAGKKQQAPQGSSGTPAGNTSSIPAPSSTPTSGSVTDINEIPEEYIPATFTHDEIDISDDNPIQGTDSDCSIRVNTALNVTTFYDATGKPVRAFACSTGRRDGHETPEGTFTLGEWIIPPMSEWCYMADGTEGLYAYRIIDGINNDIMFHSVPYFEADHGTLEYEEYNKLGDYASMGCIRMCTADCRWLGEHCATGTEVVIYYDENEQLPLEKPDPIRIPTDIEQVRGWDPTDPISTNPWHSYKIDLQIPNSVTVQKDTDYAMDPVIAAATVTDNYGNDLSGYTTYTGTFDSSTPDVYPIHVTCDVGPAHAYKDIYVVVK